MKPILYLCFATAFVFASCEGGSENPDPAPVPPAKPIELTSRGAEKIAADNDFAFRFFRETLATATDKTNAFVSPLSLTMALGMLYNGTSPAAAAEMEEALGVSGLTPEEINAHYQTLARALLAADPKTALAIANSIWTHKDYPVKQTFCDINRTFYDAEVLSRDFRLPATVDEINGWCAANTNDQIPTIIDEIPLGTVMYLIDAVYFKGQWKFEFDRADTRDEEFSLADGSTKNVKMMTQETDLPCYRDGTMQCVDLPYGNGAFSMMVVMPAAETVSLDELVASFDADAYDRATDGLEECGVMLKLPRWKQECEFPLKDAVENLGMERIFHGGNLTGIANDPSLAVSEIRQKAFVEVTEEGTEAAAVTIIGDFTTSVGGGSTAMPFIVDRPFLYLIRERSTGAILFIGRMDDPA